MACTCFKRTKSIEEDGCFHERYSLPPAKNIAVVTGNCVATGESKTVEAVATVAAHDMVFASSWQPESENRGSVTRRSIHELRSRLHENIPLLLIISRCYSIRNMKSRRRSASFYSEWKLL